MPNFEEIGRSRRAGRRRAALALCALVAAACGSTVEGSDAGLSRGDPGLGDQETAAGVVSDADEPTTGGTPGETEAPGETGAPGQATGSDVVPVPVNRPGTPTSPREGSAGGPPA